MSSNTVLLRPRSALCALTAAALLCTPALVAAQPRQGRTLADLKELPGPVVAEAAGDARPDEGQAVTGYQVRRLELPSPWRVWLGGQPTLVHEAWHVRLSFARPLTVRAQAFSLVVDGRWCGFLAEAPDLLSADSVCFDPALMRDGAVLGATYRGVTITGADEVYESAPMVEFDGEGEEPLYQAAPPLQFKEPR